MIAPILNEHHYVNTHLEKDEMLRSTWDKVWDVVCRIFHAISFILFSMLPHFFAYIFCPSSSYVSLDQKPEWKENSEGLFLFTTGLFGHPVWSAPYLAQIEQERPHFDVKIPYIPHEGNCPLDEAAVPIANMVKDYIKTHPGKPVCIIGVSNGGRIAARVSELCRQEEVSMFVGSLAGIFFGTQQMEHYKHSPIFHPAIVSDFTFNSLGSKTLIEEMRRPIAKGSRHFEFYTGNQENVIPNFSSCLPILGLGEKHLVLRGHDHMTITEGARAEVMKNAYAWIDALPRKT